MRLALLTCLLMPLSLLAQTVGDDVLLIERSRGIPGHPGPGNNSVAVRFPGNTVVHITDLDTPTGWFEVDDGAGNLAWIVRRYIATW